MSAGAFDITSTSSGERGSARRVAGGVRTREPAADAEPPICWGRSAAMRELADRIERVAPTGHSVLLCGETGTGKGLLARAIHARSERARAPFVHVDCAALPGALIESELYGHERGAFTGAAHARRGRFELARGGTLFLDEIAELGLGAQAKLLRVLQDREFERVGGERTIRLDARVVAATNRDLAAEIEAGGFRRDLYYRLAVLELRVPPLRERLVDLPVLVEWLRARAVRDGRRGIRAVTQDGLVALAAHDWSGNVRELVNVIERIEVLWPDAEVDAGRVARSLGGRRRRDGADTSPPVAEELERVLAACEGNVSRAARELCLPRSTLRYRLRVAGARARRGVPEQLALPLQPTRRLDGRD